MVLRKVFDIMEYEGEDIAYTVNLEKSDIFCPCCGKQSSWKDLENKDFYLGYDYYCEITGNIFKVPSIEKADEDYSILFKEADIIDD